MFASIDHFVPLFCNFLELLCIGKGYYVLVKCSMLSSWLPKTARNGLDLNISILGTSQDIFCLIAYARNHRNHSLSIVCASHYKNHLVLLIHIYFIVHSSELPFLSVQFLLCAQRRSKDKIIFYKTISSQKSSHSLKT